MSSTFGSVPSITSVRGNPSNAPVPSNAAVPPNPHIPSNACPSLDSPGRIGHASAVGLEVGQVLPGLSLSTPSNAARPGAAFRRKSRRPGRLRPASITPTVGRGTVVLRRQSGQFRSDASAAVTPRGSGYRHFRRPAAVNPVRHLRVIPVDERVLDRQTSTDEHAGRPEWWEVMVWVAQQQRLGLA